MNKPETCQLSNCLEMPELPDKSAITQGLAASHQGKEEGSSCVDNVEIPRDFFYSAGKYTHVISLFLPRKRACHHIMLDISKRTEHPRFRVGYLASQFVLPFIRSLP